MVNKVILIGNVGNVRELIKIGSSQISLFSFSLATSKNRKAQDGFEERVQWHTIKMLGTMAENASRMIDKGKKVYIEGEINYNTVEKNGEKITYTDIVAYSFCMLSSKEKSDINLP